MSKRRYQMTLYLIIDLVSTFWMLNKNVYLFFNVIIQTKLNNKTIQLNTIKYSKIFKVKIKSQLYNWYKLKDHVNDIFYKQKHKWFIKISSNIQFDILYDIISWAFSHLFINPGKNFSNTTVNSRIICQCASVSPWNHSNNNCTSLIIIG